MRPVEGTILTVARRDRRGDRALDAPSLVVMLDRAAEAGRGRGGRAPPICCRCSRDAGVVDAGGKGLTLLLDALLEVVDGRPIPEPELVGDARRGRRAPRGRRRLGPALRGHVPPRRDDATLPAFRDAWGAIGDSIVVVGGDGIWNCHVHTNDIGAAVEAGIDAGRPHQIRVTDLMEQVEEERWVREAEVVGRSQRGGRGVEPGRHRGGRGRRR